MDEREKIFEGFIESYLISEEGGWAKATDAGLRSEESRGMNLDIVTLTDFVKSTQPMAWRRFERMCTINPVRQFYKSFENAVTQDGLISVLRYGFKHRGINFRVCYFKPESELNDLAVENYKKNVCQCILCSYLAKLLPSDKTQPFDLDNRVKLEYYRLEKTYEGAIELEATPGSWKPTQPKRAGGQKDRLSPLDEIIARINEEFFGDFTDADRVMVDTLYTKMRQDAKVKKAAKSNDRQVYERSIFPGIFDTTAQQAYMENTEAYEQLFLDAEKYRIIQQALAERLYRELHGDSK